MAPTFLDPALATLATANTAKTATAMLKIAKTFLSTFSPPFSKYVSLIVTSQARVFIRRVGRMLDGTSTNAGLGPMSVFRFTAESRFHPCFQGSVHDLV